MPSLPTEALLGVSFGLLVGVAPAILVGVLGYASTAYRGRPLPRPLTVVVALPLAGASAYLLGVVDPVASQAPRVVLGSFVVVLLSLYGNSQGRWLAETLPRDVSLPTVRGRTLSADAAPAIDGTGNVTVRASGEIRDVDGYPPLSPDSRTALGEATWQLPADLPLRELEARLEDRIRARHDLAVVSVSVDARGHATIAAAPSESGVAARVPDGCRAVSVPSLVPSGLAPDDEVVVSTAEGSASGTVLAVPAASSEGDAGANAADARITVAVPTEEASLLMDADRARTVAVPRGTRRDFEAVSLLERAGVTVRKLPLVDAVREVLDAPDGDASLLAARTDDADEVGAAWRVAPDDAATADVGFVAAPTPVLERLDREVDSSAEVAR